MKFHPYQRAYAHRIRAVVALCVMVASSATALVSAQEASTEVTDDAQLNADFSADTYARKVFAAGKEAYQAGNYSEALRYFQQAYEMSGRSQMLYNVGQAADRLRMDETALTALKRYLDELPNAANRQEVEGRIRMLKDVITRKQGVALADSHSRADDQAAARIAGHAPDSALTSDSGSDRDDSSLLTKWWVWAGAGAVVTVVVITALVLSADDTTKTREPYAGTNRKVVSTLTVNLP